MKINKKMNEYKIKVSGVLTLYLVKSLRIWFKNHGFESSRIIQVDNTSFPNFILIKCAPEVADALWEDGEITWIKSVENTFTTPIFMQNWSSSSEDEEKNR